MDVDFGVALAFIFHKILYCMCQTQGPGTNWGPAKSFCMARGCLKSIEESPYSRVS